MRRYYLLLAVIGAVLPYTQILPWLVEQGLNLRLLVAELFSTRPGAFFALDVLISALAVISLIRRDGSRHGVRLQWLPIAATCLVGVSCGLPLFLYLREAQRRAATPA
jgi:Terpene cyclase DEP1